MPNMNKFNGCGHLAKDPETKFSAGGTAFCNFSVGISDSEKVGGEWTKVTEWVSGTVFGKQAEWLGEAKKGDVVIFSGKLKTRSWDKDGVKQYRTEVICDSAEAIKKSSNNVNNDTQIGYKSNSANTQQDPYAPSDLEDEIPF